MREIRKHVIKDGCRFYRCTLCDSLKWESLFGQLKNTGSTCGLRSWCRSCETAARSILRGYIPKREEVRASAIILLIKRNEASCPWPKKEVTYV